MAAMNGRRGATRGAVSGSDPRPLRGLARGGGSYEVAFDARPAFDFLISLFVGDGAENDLLPEDRAWLGRTREALAPGLRSDMVACFDDQGLGIFEGLTALLTQQPGIRTAADVVGAVQAAGPRGIARTIVSPLLPSHAGPGLLERALDGEPGALDGLEGALPDHGREPVMALLRDLDPSVARMTGVLRGWLPAFEEIEPRIGRLQDADVAWRNEERVGLDQGTLIERVTGGLRWLPDPAVRRVCLVPSYFARPYNYVYQGGDWRLFCYPIADRILEAADPATPPQSMVRLHRALGDPSRMRILRLLCDRDLYLTELAAQLEVSKPTTKHHLALLRAAGLVTVTEEGSLTYYSLRRERIEEAAAELQRYLG
jgi:DNA-binding transcriptional ArsR family regulator